MRAPSTGSSSAADQNRRRVGWNPRRRANRPALATCFGRWIQPVRPASTWATSSSRAGGVRVRAGRDDVLRGAAEEQAPEQVEAGVEVEVEGGRGEQDEREPDGGLGDGDEAACEGDRGVGCPDQWRLWVDVGGLHLDPTPKGTQAPREVTGGAPLGVGAG